MTGRDPLTRRQAAVYRAAGDTYRVVPDDRTTTGLGLARDEVVRLEAPTDEELGVAALAALSTSGRTVPRLASQSDWSANTRAFMRAMGYRSHRQLMAENSAVVLRWDGEDVTIIPTENRDTKGGYAHRTVDAQRIAPSPESVGRACETPFPIMPAHVTFTTAERGCEHERAHLL